MNIFFHRVFGALGVFSLAVSLSVAAAGQTPSRNLSGTVTAIDGSNVTIKTAQGDVHKVQIPSTADIKRIEPGQTSLSAAVAMQLTDLASGDKVLITLDPNSTDSAPQARRLIAIKAADLAQKRQQEAADWQINGFSGLVKSTDEASGTIFISSGSGPTARSYTIHTAPGTILKRYAATSVSYDSAQPGPFSAIKSGDQLMARGAKNPDGYELIAKEVVSGSFRNISGLIASIDADHQSFTIKDLATKKVLTVMVPAEAQMRQVPGRVAQMLAMRLKGTAAGASGAGGGQGGGARPAAPAGGGPAPAGGYAMRGGAGGGGGYGGGDPQQMLSRLPAIHFSDLQKGQAVMLVASAGDSQVTAISLLSGVEALLEAPASQDLLASWSMGGGGGEGGGEGGAQ